MKALFALILLISFVPPADAGKLTSDQLQKLRVIADVVGTKPAPITADGLRKIADERYKVFIATQHDKILEHCKEMAELGFYNANWEVTYITKKDVQTITHLLLDAGFTVVSYKANEKHERWIKVDWTEITVEVIPDKPERE